MSDFIESLRDSNPYSLGREEKRIVYFEALTDLTRHHYEACPEYRTLIDKLGVDTNNCESVEDLPFLPVNLFKEYQLMSVKRNDVVQVLTSSGTSGANLSNIYLDRLNAKNQKRALIDIVTVETGKKRAPMLIIDTKATVKAGQGFSGRAAGIAGFSFLGTDIVYALNENMELDWETLEKFFERHRGSRVILFGFTYMIWKYFCSPVVKTDKCYQLEDSILIHGGGWKKLNDESVNNEVFRQVVEKVTGVKKVINYYGMVEQTGSIFLECEAGHFHCTNFSDVMTRDEKFSPCQFGETGIVQLLSPLATSYPGHNILSEDSGVIIGEDDCICGKNGKYFNIQGRIKDADVRGCSDAYQGR
jgi:hypothetical protein